MVTFETRQNRKGIPAEYVKIESGVDLVHRAATAEDREKYPGEYAEFTGVTVPRPVVAPVVPTPLVTFELRVQPGDKAAAGPVEYVRILIDKDVVHRLATDDDRKRWWTAYQAFLDGPPPSPVKTDDELRAEDTTATYAQKEQVPVLAEGSASSEDTPVDAPTGGVKGFFRGKKGKR